ncbi:MAG: hydratase [Gammaproteobacteria bacterium]|nr:hydratase [Gammaproteobacteria bacterium]
MTQKNSSAAVELARRRAAGKTGPLLNNEIRPRSFDEAFSLQQKVGDIFAAVSASGVAGWKCALPSDDKQIIAALYASTMQQQRPQTPALCQLYPDKDGLAAVEPELAFELKHDVPPRATPYSEAEIDAAIATTRLALELIQSRYDSPEQATFFDALADGLLNQGVWLGPELPENTPPDLAEFLLTIQYADGTLETKQAKHPNGNSRAGLYWLVNFLSAQGIGMHKGQQIITGSYAGVLKFAFGEAINLRYGDLGEFSIIFEAK